MYGNEIVKKICAIGFKKTAIAKFLGITVEGLSWKIKHNSYSEFQIEKLETILKKLNEI